MYNQNEDNEKKGTKKKIIENKLLTSMGSRKT